MTHSLQTLNIEDALNGRNMIDISFSNIVYEVEAHSEAGQKYKKTLLHGISGIFKGGELNVIMGASGAGKTTLLNILAGRITEFAGELKANDKPYDFNSFGDFANYVMQGDIMMETLTVRETLEFSANLRLQAEGQVEARINLLVKQLKLEKCLEVVVGGNLIKGISGGEKKRTSIAVELISDPQVIVLDEPTSGMDSLTSFIIINELKNLAKQGKTVFLTIHQPNSEIYALFDHMLLMIEGRIIYQGTAEKSLSYFKDSFQLQCPQFQNPADYYMSIMHHEDKANVDRYPQYFQVYQKKIASSIVAKIENREKREFPMRVSESGFFRTLRVLLRRDLLNIIRSPIIMKGRIIQVIFISIFTGGLYFNAGRVDYTNTIQWYAITGYLFFISMDLFMQAMVPTTITFPIERMVFLKEENSKLYSLAPYFVSRNIIELPYIVFVPFIFLLINYWMIGLASTAQQFFTMYLVILLLSFTATSAGMMAGSLISDPKLVSNMVLVLALPFIVFSGFFKNYSSMPNWIGWIRFISPFNYSYTALVGNETLYKDSLVSQVHFDVSMWIAVLTSALYPSCFSGSKRISYSDYIVCYFSKAVLISKRQLIGVLKRLLRINAN